MPRLASEISSLRVMEDVVSQGHFGFKSGKGLLDWPAESAASVLHRRKEELLRRRYTDRKSETKRSA
jgi:hypothetical protein